MTFSVNDGPLAGQDGDKVQAASIRERLLREAEGNVAIRVRESEERDAFEVAGRGELQLGGADRDHAPRGLRALRRPPARRCSRPTRPASGWSRSRRS